MSERIKFADGATFQCPEQPKAPVHPYSGGGREWRKITVTATVEAVKAAFVDNASYAREWDSLVTAEDGSQTMETISQDLSAYSLAGDVVDLRDGNVAVYMGKPTELELTQAALDELILMELGGEPL